MKQLYFIAIIPSEPLNSEVNKLKLHFSRQYQSKHALKSPPHITLQKPFKLHQERESELFGLLSDLALKTETFSLQLSGFGCFAPRVIYIEITKHQSILHLHFQLKKQLLNLLEQHDFSEKSYPHITIATRDLTEENFHKAWAEYESREFTGRFFVNSIFLLKHNGKHWEIYREFGFNK